MPGMGTQVPAVSGLRHTNGGMAASEWASTYEEAIQLSEAGTMADTEHTNCATLLCRHYTKRNFH